MSPLDGPQPQRPGLCPHLRRRAAPCAGACGSQRLLCLALVIAGLALQSAVLILALVPIGAVAGWTRRHPFDLIWNHGPRHLSGAPELPPNPTPRRHAFKLATVWLLAVGLLFAFGQPTAALILGGLMVAVCGLLTTTNFCVPSTLLGIWWRRRGTPLPTTQPS